MRLASILLAAAAVQDDDAQASLRKMGERLKDVKTLSAKVTQSRRTPLLAAPLTSSGLMLYRRAPAKLVFKLDRPRNTEIHFDRESYQVHRPDEKRLERIEFEGDDVLGRLLMVFDPKPDVLGSVFSAKSGARADGKIEVVLEPTDEKVRRRLRSVAVTLTESDGTISKLAYVDGEGDEVVFAMTDLVLNPELPAGTFELTVPEGTRVLRHTVRVKD